MAPIHSHEQIDRRSLFLAREVARVIDADPDRRGLAKARDVCNRWLSFRSDPVLHEWKATLDKPWEEVRAVLLDPGEEGRRLRQSTPFCGIIPPRRRWELFKEFKAHAAT